MWYCRVLLVNVVLPALMDPLDSQVALALKDLQALLGRRVDR